MPEFLQRLFSADGFMPHGHCYFWNGPLIVLHVVSDGFTTLAYVSISAILVYFARKRRDLPFKWMFVCFGVFIVSCGVTHAMEIWTLWTPVYWLAGVVKAITGVASIGTAILLAGLVPKALALPGPSQLRVALAERERSEEALRLANRELEAFSYSVAHDLRAPLRGMSGFAQLLLDDYRDRLGVDGRDWLQEIVGNAAKMGHLIDALLAMAKLTRVELKPEPVDLAELSRATAFKLAMSDPRRSVELVVRGRLMAQVDPQLARTLVDNLVGNAWKFTRKSQSPRIEVGTVEKEGVSAFFVRDNGAGFDMAYANKLFAPFQRLHTPDEFEGTGVGLATVHRIVQRHGGEVWAEGAVGGGATFYFTLADRREEKP